MTAKNSENGIYLDGYSWYTALGFNFDNSSVAFENVNSAINLNNLGFVVGTEVSVVSAIGGNVIVNIKDSRIAINEDMAKRIMV